MAEDKDRVALVPERIAMEVAPGPALSGQPRGHDEPACGSSTTPVKYLQEVNNHGK
jgi:hypothetical protein